MIFGVFPTKISTQPYLYTTIDRKFLLNSTSVHTPAHTYIKNSKNSSEYTHLHTQAQRSFFKNSNTSTHNTVINLMPWKMGGLEQWILSCGIGDCVEICEEELMQLQEQQEKHHEGDKLMLMSYCFWSHT